ncbi:Manganese ABC transporter substrate-binding lipoprotein precursor [Gimesia chilikensis]|uniref:Manganese ABC transporter substrate-binding lipoprotein n=1 Tax=Gimesia chilikensis TaxID=2605989 RepID=A0A517WGU3_9PLAN|nr:Manganese ABC transporter substrate-binding lipoprotein precursor [Gimesia chilikensis]
MKRILKALKQAARTSSFYSITSSLLILLVTISGCDQKDIPAEGPALQIEQVDVYVVNYPLAFFTKRLGGELVQITFPVPADQVPAYWEPDENDMTGFQSADLILLNGADYAKWTLRTSLPWSRTVVTTRNVEDQIIEVPNAVTHQHGLEGEHSHAGLASETWIDPQMAISQAGVIKDELQKLLPNSADVIENNFEQLKDELQQLDKEFNSVFAKSKLPWTASCPAFQYLGRRYHPQLKTVNWDPSVPPTEEQWAEFHKLLAGKESLFMLWTDQPDTKTLDRLKSRGVQVVVFRLAEQDNQLNDYLSIMRDNLDNLKAATATQTVK